MSQQRISLSPDLTLLREEGYEVAIRYDHLVVTGVPYLNSTGEVRLGTLVSDLSMAGDVTAKPENHVAMFAGEFPCDKDGRPLEKLRHGSGDTTIGNGLVTNHSFSRKPPGGYTDYHHKMTTYVALISKHARDVDPNVTAQTRRVVENEDPESPFVYLDTATGRAGVSAVSRKLELARVGIFGVGGTGGYVLDQVAKTPVLEIAIFDGDEFLQHNAFRAPGAPSIGELKTQPKKVDYLKGIYSKMHRGIVAHDFFIDETTVQQIGIFDFAFICMDPGTPKRLLVEYLEANSIPFVDVGMGLELIDDTLTGILRVTASTPEKREHVREHKRISFTDAGIDNLYSKNIQIADLNALNAALAVLKWKKLFGFYADLEREHNSLYLISGNTLINGDES
ncbi:MAG: ThiF family adenylyltransferase [Candidatus Andeanibacterium colombiense]|uniref:ThiF family adenylyltransferase n=1 Tax=Candidatus Andeanibacterium colombiense TaxID=3121345 RepID=A0AAJ5X838_9SPHN|nr:MAG: ThiF family adenylyltransferase [Sphingomonadaceae bacterium]